MRKTTMILLIAAGIVCAAVVFGRPLQQDAQDILKNEAMQAINRADFALGDGLLSTDYVGVRHSDGRLLSASTEASMLFTSIDTRGLQVDVLGDTGIVTGILGVNGSEYGKPVAARYRYSRIYANRSGQWTPLFTQFTRIHGR